MIPATFVEIVGKDDSRYLNWQERSIAASKERKASRSIDPIASAYGQAMRELEFATFSHLAKTCQVVSERILITPNTGDPRWGMYQCEEIDCVVYTSGSPKVLCEIKHSVSPVYSTMAARGQIAKRLEKARARWPELSGLLICFYLSWLKPPPFEPFATMCQAELEARLVDPNLPQDNTRVFMVEAISLIDRLVDCSLLAPDFRDRLTSLYRANNDPFGEIQTSNKNPASGLVSIGDLLKESTEEG